MIHIKKRILKSIEELMLFFFSVGAKDISTHFERKENGYILTVSGDYDPQKIEHLKHLEEHLNAPKDPAVLECFWELAGESDVTSDSELYLVGQMADKAVLNITPERAEVILEKTF